MAGLATHCSPSVRALVARIPSSLAGLITLHTHGFPVEEVNPDLGIDRGGRDSSLGALLQLLENRSSDPAARSARRTVRAGARDANFSRIFGRDFFGAAVASEGAAPGARQS